MQATRLPRAVLEATAHEAYLERYPEGAPRGDPPKNVSSLLLLLKGESVRVPYRGREYTLGYVSFEDGLKLVEAQVVVEALDGAEDVSPESGARFLKAMRAIVSMCPRYLEPVGRVRRFFWRLRIRRNPFKNATDAEVGQFLGFFLASRTRSRARHPTPAVGAAPSPQTS